jgi:hypothetical protein
MIGWPECHGRSIKTVEDVVEAAAKAYDLILCTQLCDGIVAGLIACSDNELVGHSTASDALNLTLEHRLPAEVLQHLARQPR